MKWLTLTEIGRRARSKKGALEVSYEHWCQLYDATAKELRAEINRIGYNLFYVEYCGLCVYNIKVEENCYDCILYKYCVGGERLWWNAKEALINWYDEEKDGDWHTWKRAAKALRDKLKELMQE